MIMHLFLSLKKGTRKSQKKERKRKKEKKERDRNNWRVKRGEKKRHSSIK
jgi:hypothetical protein